MFNILCEHPETVAAFLVPRARTVVARGQEGQYIRYLTTGKALLRFLAAPARVGRFFNAQGGQVGMLAALRSNRPGGRGREGACCKPRLHLACMV